MTDRQPYTDEVQREVEQTKQERIEDAIQSAIEAAGRRYANKDYPALMLTLAFLYDVLEFHPERKTTRTNGIKSAEVQADNHDLPFHKPTVRILCEVFDHVLLDHDLSGIEGFDELGFVVKRNSQTTEYLRLAYQEIGKDKFAIQAWNRLEYHLTRRDPLYYKELGKRPEPNEDDRLLFLRKAIEAAETAAVANDIVPADTTDTYALNDDASEL